MQERHWFALGAAIVLAGALTAAIVAPAGAGAPAENITLTKVVVGAAPAGTEFTLHSHCVAGATTIDQNFTFPAAGSQSFIPPDTGSGGVCTITETASGGATTTGFTCTPGTGSPGCSAPSATQALVDYADTAFTATVTVTNTFPTTPTTVPAAEAVRAAPAFTG